MKRGVSALGTSVVGMDLAFISFSYKVRRVLVHSLIDFQPQNLSYALGNSRQGTKVTVSALVCSSALAWTTATSK